jgi:hypothetical protein
MYRSSLTLAFVVLCSASAAASDLSSVYVAPGGIYAPSADVYVRPGPAYQQRPYAEPGYGYRQPSYYGAPGYGTPGPAYRAPASVYGEYGPGYAARPVYVDRERAYPERYYAQERYYAPERHYARERYYAQDYDYAPEYAPRPPLPVPYRARARCDDGYGRWASCD